MPAVAIVSQETARRSGDRQLRISRQMAAAWSRVASLGVLWMAAFKPNGIRRLPGPCGQRGPATWRV